MNNSSTSVIVVMLILGFVGIAVSVLGMRPTYGEFMIAVCAAMLSGIYSELVLIRKKEPGFRGQ